MDFTHPSLFGKDHWSLLAYVETCCVDGQDGIGTLDRRRLRVGTHFFGKKVDHYGKAITE